MSKYRRTACKVLGLDRPVLVPMAVTPNRRSRGMASMRPRRQRWKRRGRGVSEVVATILLLALTVTLFSAIFAFVTSFPSPPAQSANQFHAKLLLAANGSATGLNITHLSGPPVPTNALVYLKSAEHPNGCPFGASISVAQGGIAGSIWLLGQTWHIDFSTFCGSSTSDPPGDNITVYIVSQANLLFSVILPGQQAVTPPVFTAVWVNPNPLSTNQSFYLNASILGVNSSSKVVANLAALPGVPSPVSMTLVNGVWTYQCKTGINETGIFEAYISVTGASGEVVSAPVSVSVLWLSP